MATITYTVTGGSLCSTTAQEHFTLSVSGGISGSRGYEAGQVQGNPSDAEVADALLVLTRRHYQGSTKAQIKTSLGGAGLAISTTS